MSHSRAVAEHPIEQQHPFTLDDFTLVEHERNGRRLNILESEVNEIEKFNCVFKNIVASYLVAELILNTYTVFALEKGPTQTLRAHQNETSYPAVLIIQ